MGRSALYCTVIVGPAVEVAKVFPPEEGRDRTVRKLPRRWNLICTVRPHAIPVCHTVGTSLGTHVPPSFESQLVAPPAQAAEECCGSRFSDLA